jgi:DNA modification methylase
MHPRVERVARASLKPNPRNARTHSNKQIAQIAASIERFGFLVPIVVDDDNLIAAGHGRWAAAVHLGLVEVPVVRARFLTDADRRAFALAENRIAELSGWNDKMLGEELSILFEGGYDLEITGFTTADLDFALPDPPGEEPEAVELPDPDTIAITRPGDLWLIGPHRLYCGDARDATSYEALLGEDRAQLVFADPPYGVKIDGHVSGLGRVHHREFAMMSGEQTPAELTAFLRAVFRLCVRFSHSGSIHYQCMDWRHMREMLDAADGVYSELKQLVVWSKTNAGMGSFYRSQHELVFVFKAGRGSHINHFGLGETGRYRTNVWTYAGANSFRKGRDTDLADHPTVKPVAMVADAIRDCSNRGDLILDPFAGSGTTLLAARKTGRRGAAMEIDPLYCDTTLRRLQAASGLRAIHASGGSFDQMATARSNQKEHTNG